MIDNMSQGYYEVSETTGIVKQEAFGEVVI